MRLKEIWTKVDNALNPFSNKNIEAHRSLLQAHSLQVGGAILNKGLVPKANNTLAQDTLNRRLKVKGWGSVLGKEKMIAGFVKGLPEDTGLVI